MGKRFDVEYDDFTGGHYVGGNAARQPRTTWTGDNVVATSDEGSLMPGGVWIASDQIGSASTTGGFTLPVVASPGGFIAITKNTSAHLVSSFGNVTNLAGTLTYQPVIYSRLGLTDTGGFLVGSDAGGPPLTTYVDLFSGVGGTSTPHYPARSGVWKWKNWYLHLRESTNRLYFSDPVSGWGPSYNYLTIGEAYTTIRAIVTTNDAIYVGASDGWWRVTGVLGQTTDIRKITKVGVDSPTTSFVPIALTATESSVFGLVSSMQQRTDGQLAYTSGTTAGVLHHGPLAENDSTFWRPSVANAGPHLVACAGKRTWTWSERLRRWWVSTNDTPLWVFPVEDPYGASQYVQHVGWTAADTLHIWRTLKDPVDPVFDSTAGEFVSATATLADHSASDPFRVHELLVEVDFGHPIDTSGGHISSAGAVRSLGVSIQADPMGDVAQQFDVDDTEPVKTTSSVMTRQWTNAQSTRRGHREMVRFSPNDGPNGTYAASPVLTMQGVKVRRVIMRCEAV